MKVGLLIDRWDPQRGGAEACMHLLAAHLTHHGHGVEILATSARGNLPAPFHRVRALGFSRGARERRLGRRMVAAARGLGCDVIVAARHVEQPDVLWLHGGVHRATMEARRLAARDGKAAKHPLVLRGRHRAFDQFEARALSGPDCGGARLVICPSEQVRQELKKHHPHGVTPCRVVANGVDLKRFQPSLRADARQSLAEHLSISESARILVTPARNPVLKGVPHLMGALTQVPGPWCWVLAGPKRPRAWLRRAKRIGLDPDSVRVVSDLPSEWLAAAADVSVQPTWRDPCPLATLEALAAGTAVVTTALSGLADCVRDSGGSVVSDPACELELARGIERLLDYPPEPARVRESVADRDLDSWLGALERELETVARSHPS